VAAAVSLARSQPNIAIALDGLIPAELARVHGWDRAARYARLDRADLADAAEWIACAALEPGGVRLFGRHWCTESPCAHGPG